MRGADATAAAAANKVTHTDVCRRIADFAVDVGGAAALDDAERPSLLWKIATWESIGGGTSEIMRGVVARRRLGLGADR